MHVLALPKWYPGLPDPQLGDFIRKQMVAVAQLHRVSVVHASPVPELPLMFREELDTADGAWELHCYYRPSLSPVLPLRKAINYRRYQQAMARGTARLVRERGKPELVHAHILTRSVYMAWLLARKWGVPFIASEQSSVFLNGRWRAKSGAARYFDRFLLRQAAAATAVSQHLAAAMEGHGLGKEMSIVPNVVPGLDLPLPAPGPSNQFLVVGDLVDGIKNISGVLHALANARKQGHDLKLEVIGGGPDREMLHRLAQELDLGDVVHWHGRLPQAGVMPVMARAGSVIVNSNVETFSVVTGEALASGKPVIATRCGGPEAFITPANGILVPVGNNNALAQAMISMAAEHHRYGPAAIRNSIGQRFSAIAVARQFDAVYQRVLPA